MARPITLIKYSLFTDSILFDTRIFLGLSVCGFNLLITSLFIGLDENRTVKTFDPVDLNMMYKKLFGKTIRSKSFILEACRGLVKKGYFVFIKNEVRIIGQHPYYSLNKDQVLYFISALDAFIEYQVKEYKSIPEFNNYAIMWKARKDVLKHVKELKKIVKIK